MIALISLSMMVIEIVTDKAVRRMTVKVREDKCAIIELNIFFTFTPRKITTEYFPLPHYALPSSP
jgi:hypothetical protein